MFGTFRPLKVEKPCFFPSASGNWPLCWPHVTLLTVLFGWPRRTVAIRLAANLRLSIGSAVLRYQERLHDLCVTEGVFHRWESASRRGLVLCGRLWVHARPVEFYRSKQVKTAHGVSPFLSHFISVAFFQDSVTVPWNVFHPSVGIPSVKPF